MPFLAETGSCHFAQMTVIFRNLSSRRRLDLAAGPIDSDGRGHSENFGTSCKRWILSEINRMPAKVIPSPQAGLREADNPDKSPKMHDYPRKFERTISMLLDHAHSLVASELDSDA